MLYIVTCYTTVNDKLVKTLNHFFSNESLARFVIHGLCKEGIGCSLEIYRDNEGQFELEDIELHEPNS